MTPSELLTHYGYAAVFVGGLFEGESLLLLGAYAVHQGYLSLLPLLACGATAAFVGDQIYFLLGRHQGRALLARRPHWQARVSRVAGFVERHPVLTIFGMRFAWGLRTVLPLTLGMSRVPPALFVPLNALAAALWATVIVLFGVQLTGWAHAALGHLHRDEHLLIGAALVLALTVALWRLLRR